MALPSSFLAAENSATDRRSRALHRFIVASPVLLLIAIGLVGHLRKGPYQSPAGNASYDAQILAYRERVTATQDLHIDENTPSSETVLSEAERWIEGLKSGDLVTIHPAVYEDHLRDGVRGEIVRTGFELAGSLAVRANLALNHHRPQETLRTALAAAELAHGLDGFELQSVLQSMIIQRRAISFVARAWPSLSQDQRAETLPRLKGLLTDPGLVESLAELDRSLFIDYGQRQKIPVASIVKGSFRDEMILAARRSVGISNARVKALLEGKGETFVSE